MTWHHAPFLMSAALALPVLVHSAARITRRARATLHSDRRALSSHCARRGRSLLSPFGCAHPFCFALGCLFAVAAHIAGVL